ncbi:response regulator transcription factor [Paenibacillus antri]|uniref:Response regulator transcription factor n=1 Tax=Paenibacillus antri TaxID=2582848 RepID=A0A5R9FWR9_9BACL|nr:response regulator transcription factor [Paenibacillus antri]TLS48437.1 response regulator transcription factor [Paenibacillus antri]
MISIVLVDDQTLLRDGLQTMINVQEDMEVVGVAGDGEQGLALVEKLRPDVVLMDIKMPGMDGLESTRRIKEVRPEVKIIVLTTFAEDDFIVESFSAGADGFLLKDLQGEQLIRSIREAAEGQLIMPSFVASRLVSLLRTDRKSGSARLSAARLKNEGIVLSPRERDIAEMLILGKSNRQIATQLFMSDGTVRNYISGIYNKIGTKDREQAIDILKRFM